jgi:hypothetical protein
VVVGHAEGATRRSVLLSLEGVLSTSEPRFEGLTLARLEPRGDPEELRATAAPKPPFEGADRSDSVWVSVSGRAVVENVEFSSRWSERLPADEVAAALFDSYRDAVQKAYGAAALDALNDRGRGSGDDAPPPVDPGAVDNGERGWLAGVRETLEGIETDMLRRARARERAATRERSVSGPLGYFRAQVQGRAVTAVTGDARLIRGAGGEQLRRDAIAVFQAAQHDHEDEGR